MTPFSTGVLPPKKSDKKNQEIKHCIEKFFKHLQTQEAHQYSHDSAAKRCATCTAFEDVFNNTTPLIKDVCIKIITEKDPTQINLMMCKIFKTPAIPLQPLEMLLQKSLSFICKRIQMYRKFHDSHLPFRNMTPHDKINGLIFYKDLENHMLQIKNVIERYLEKIKNWKETHEKIF